MTSTEINIYKFGFIPLRKQYIRYNDKYVMVSGNDICDNQTQHLTTLNSY